MNEWMDGGMNERWKGEKLKFKGDYNEVLGKGADLKGQWDSLILITLVEVSCSNLEIEKWSAVEKIGLECFSQSWFFWL